PKACISSQNFSTANPTRREESHEPCRRTHGASQRERDRSARRRMARTPPSRGLERSRSGRTRCMVRGILRPSHRLYPRRSRMDARPSLGRAAPPAKSRWRAWRGSRLPLLAKIAAAVAVLSAAGAGSAIYFKAPPQKVYATAIGERKTLALSDGSKVEMNTDTVLRVVADGSGRTVWLEKGEAYFQVRHDSAHPFTVMAGGHRVTDLGTKFLVRTDAQKLQVSLVEGSIRFDAPDGRMREPLLLSPGDSVTAKENTIVVTRNSERELAKDLGWRRGVLVFDNTTLADAAAEFNRYNREKIVIADPAVAQLRIDGTCPNENLAVFARAAQQLFELHIVERNGKTVISK